MQLSRSQDTKALITSKKCFKELGFEHGTTTYDMEWQRSLPTQTVVIIKIIKVSRGRKLVGMDDGSRNVPATDVSLRLTIMR